MHPTPSANNSDEYTESVEEARVNGPLILLTVSAAIGGFLFGYDTGIISGALLSLDNYFDLSYLTKEIIVAGATAGAIIGALLSPKLNLSFGRQKTILSSGFIFIIGAIVMAIAWNVEILIAGRVLVGIAVGIASTTVPVYISECSPPLFRGRLVTIFGVKVVIGQFVAYAAAYILSVDLKNGWRWMLGLGSVPALLLVAGMFCLPESPRMLVARGDILNAEKALKWLRGGSSDKELDEIVSDVEHEKAMPKMTRFEILKRMWFNPGTRLTLIVGVGLQIFQQIIGINAVMYYSGEILKAAGYTDRKAILGSMYVAIVGMLSSISSLFVVDRSGRRPILIISTIGVIFSLVALFIAFYVNIRWMAIISQCAYVLFFQAGLGPIPWTMNAEIYPLWARSVGTGTSTTFNWVFNLIVSLTFLSMVQLFGGSFGAIFLLYGAIAVVGLIFFAIKVPETKGKTLEDITHMFEKLANTNSEGYQPL